MAVSYWTWDSIVFIFIFLSLHWFFSLSVCFLYLRIDCFLWSSLALCHWNGRLVIHLELLCQVQTLWPHLLVLFMFLHWIQSNILDSPGLLAVQVHHGSCYVTFWFLSYGILPWLSGIVSCVISNIIWWHKSFWYCPFSSCHSVQMCLQINWFPSGFSFQGLHVITCEMWPKPMVWSRWTRSSQAVTYSMFYQWIVNLVYDYLS